MANKYTINTWQRERRYCPVCDSVEYVYTGKVMNSCKCLHCKYVYQANIDYNYVPDLNVTNKNITTHKVFRYRFGIDKSFGMLFFKDKSVKCVEFLKNGGVSPVNDKRLAYTINNRDLCIEIGHGKYRLIHVQDFVFKIKKLS